MTIDELQALPDKELNALAAKLRGLKTFNFQGVKWLGVTDAQGVTHGKHKLREWTPATSRDQSGELLTWAWRNHGILFHIGFTGGASPGYVQFETPVTHHTVRGNDARAETIAFCAAMLALKTQNRPAPKD